MRVEADQFIAKSGQGVQETGSDMATSMQVMCEQTGVTQRVREEEEGMETSNHC